MVWVMIVTAINVTGALNQAIEVSHGARVYKSAEACLDAKERNLKKLLKEYSSVKITCASEKIN